MKKNKEKNNKSLVKDNSPTKNEDLESWKLFFVSFKHLWTAPKTRLNLIYSMIFSILTIIVGYFLGDFILSKNAFGIIFSIIFYLVFFAFALYTLRWTLNLVLKENQHAADPIRFSLLLISVFVPTVLGAILAAVVSLMDNSEILVAGSYVSLILIVIFYLCNIIFIFWGEKLSPYIDKIEKRIAKILKGKRKKDEN